MTNQWIGRSSWSFWGFLLFVTTPVAVLGEPPGECGWMVETPSEVVEQTAEAPLVIWASRWSSWNCESETFSFQVFAPDGTQLNGTESELERVGVVLWHSDSSLDAGIDYRVVARFEGVDNWDSQNQLETFEFILRTSTDSATPPVPEAFSRFDLSAYQEPSAETECCEAADQNCGQDYCDYCWISDYEYKRLLTLVWEISTELDKEQGFYQVSARQNGGDAFVTKVGPLGGLSEHHSENYVYGAFPYCVQIEIILFQTLESVLSSEWKCLEEGDVILPSGQLMNPPDLSQCLDVSGENSPPTEMMPGDSDKETVLDGSLKSGCVTVVTAQRGSGRDAGLLGFLLIGMWGRTRRQRGSRKVFS
jgi:hypothetical protein